MPLKLDADFCLDAIGGPGCYVCKHNSSGGLLICMPESLALVRRAYKSIGTPLWQLKT